MTTSLHTDVVVVGGGQAGLAMSRCLTDDGVDHVVLERGRVANAWRTERWDSLRLLTPNWMTRLPHREYAGEDPDGFLPATEVVTFLEDYRRSFSAPVREDTTVTAISRTDSGAVVRTDAGSWRTRAVVVATGACGTPRRPAVAAALPDRIHQVDARDYRNPDQLPGTGILVVGASSSGLQVADELVAAGREVTLAAGEHVRVPRTYRGMDVHWWMDLVGAYAERYDEVEDLARARRVPSMQLVGSAERRDLDLNAVSRRGVSVVGRLMAADGERGLCSGSLANVCALADLKQGRLLNRFDQYAAEHGLDAELGPPERPEPTQVDPTRLGVDLRAVDTVVWATGYRPSYPWLPRELLDANGQVRHEGGTMDAAGMYVLGLPFLRRRSSNLIDGVGRDAQEVAAHLSDHLDRAVGR